MQAIAVGTPTQSILPDFEPNNPDTVQDRHSALRAHLLVIRHAEPSLAEMERPGTGIKVWNGFKRTGLEIKSFGSYYTNKEYARRAQIERPGSSICASEVLEHSVITDHAAIKTPHKKTFSRGHFLLLHYDMDNKKFDLVKSGDVKYDKLACEDNKARQDRIISTLNNFPLRIDTLHTHYFIKATAEINLNGESSHLTSEQRGIQLFLQCAANLTELLAVISVMSDPIVKDSPLDKQIKESIELYKDSRHVAKQCCKELRIHIYSTTESNMRMAEGIFMPVKVIGVVGLAIAGLFRLGLAFAASPGPLPEDAMFLRTNLPAAHMNQLDLTSNDVAETNGNPIADVELHAERKLATSSELNPGTQEVAVASPNIQADDHGAISDEVDTVLRTKRSVAFNGIEVSQLTPRQFTRFISRIRLNQIKETNWDQWSEVTPQQFTALLKKFGVQAGKALDSVKTESLRLNRDITRNLVMVKKETTLTYYEFLSNWTSSVSEEEFRSAYPYLSDPMKELSLNYRSLVRPIMVPPICGQTISQMVSARFVEIFGEDWKNKVNCTTARIRMEMLTSVEFARAVDFLNPSHLAETKWDLWSEVMPEQFTKLMKKLGSQAAGVFNSVESRSEKTLKFGLPTSKGIQFFINWAKVTSREEVDSVLSHIPEWARDISRENALVGWRWTTSGNSNQIVGNL